MLLCLLTGHAAERKRTAPGRRGARAVPAGRLRRLRRHHGECAEAGIAIIMMIAI
mgnify:CR=1 FL=1